MLGYLTGFLPGQLRILSERRSQRVNLRMLSLVDYTDAHTMEVAHGNRLVLRLTKYA
jgi:hypothetical protein